MRQARQYSGILLVGGCLLALLWLMTAQAFAATTVASGYCGGEGDGTNLTWTLDSSGTLTISGKGKMADYTQSASIYLAQPWGGYYSSLKKLVIENGVTSIGNCAFYGCTGFTGDLTIGNSVTSIGRSAFSECTGFTGSLTIPSGVTSIGNYAFYGCSGIEGVYFRGNAPTVGKSPFDSGSTLYYIPRTTGWTDSSAYNASTGTWNGYTLKTWDGYRQITTRVAENIPSGQYSILVINNAGEPLANATVDYNGVCRMTDKNGIALFTKSTLDYLKLTVSCSGYKTRVYGNYAYVPNGNGYEIVTLYTEKDSDLRLAYAYYQAAAGLPTTDLLTETKRLSLSKLSLDSKSETEATFTLRCKAIEADTATRYDILQDGRVIATSEDGEFSLELSSFLEDGAVFVRVYGLTEEPVDTPINLSFVDDVGEDFKEGIKLGDKFTMTIPADIPYVGGSKINLDIPDLPVDIVVNEDTIHVGLNVRLSKDDKTNDTLKEDFQDDLDDLKDVMNQLKDLKDLTNMSASLKQKIEKFTTDKKMNVPAAGKVNANIIGYGEGKLDEDGLSEIKVELYVIITYSKSVAHYTVVWVVPLTWDIEVGLEGKTSAVVTFDWPENSVSGNLKITLTPELKAFFGTGVGKLVGAGAYGSAKLPIEVTLLSTAELPGLEKIDLTGDLGLKVYCGFFEYKKSFAYQTWHIYTRTKGKALRTAAVGDYWMAGTYDEDTYTVADISYLADESAWLSDGTSLISAEGGAEEVSELTPLLKNTYRNMQPVLGEADGMPVLVWVRANTDASRGAFDYPQLVYSVYDSGRWTEPQPVDADNLTADAAPSLATAPDGTLYLAWQSSAEQMAEGADAADYAAAQTVVVARFDAEEEAFTDFTTVSEQGVFSRSPVISADGSAPLVAWVANSQNDYFMQNETGSIHYAQLVNGEWQSGVLAENCSTVTDLAVGIMNGEPTVAAVLDGDADLTTTGDSVLLCYPALSGAKQVADGSIGGIALAELPGTTGASLLWFDGEGLRSYNGTETTLVFETAQQLNGFTVLSDRVLFNAASGDGSDLFAFVYDSGAWSDAVQVTAQEQYLQSYAAAEIGNTVYLAAVQADVTITDDGVEDSCTLAWGILDPVTDLAVCAVSVDHAEEKPNGELAVSVDIQNLGDTAVSGFVVTIYDKDSKAVASKSFDVSIAPSAVETVSLPMTLGQTVTTEEYTVTVAAVGDSVEDNDSAKLTVGYSDLDVSASLVQIGESNKVYIRVANNGAVTSGGEMTISCGDTTLQIVEVEELASGEISLYEVSVGKEQLGGELSGMIHVALTSTEADYNAFNDSGDLFVRLPYTEGVEILGVSGQTVSVQVQNAEKACVYAALYDANGRMLCIARQTAETDAGKLSFKLDADALAKAAKLRVFVLDAASTAPRMRCAEMSL